MKPWMLKAVSSDKRLRLASRAVLPALLVALLPLTLVGCDEDSSPTVIAFTELEAGTQATVNRRRIEILDNLQDYEQVYYANTISADPPPDVDFTQERVLALFLGTTASGDSIALTRVTRHSSHMELEVTVALQPFTCPAPPTLHRPYQLSAIPFQERLLVVKEVLTLRSCD